MSKTSVAVRQEPPVVANMASPLTNGGMMSDMMRVAEYMATSRTIPAHLQKNPGDCLRIVELAWRLGMSPYAVADGTCVISGKLAHEGKLVAAMINSSPRIGGSLSYEYDGDGKSRCVIVTGRMRGETKDRSVTVSVEQGLRDSKGARQRWIDDADQMLAYYGARVWARRHAPEVMLGIYTPDELTAGGRGEVHDLLPREPVDITPKDEPEPEPQPVKVSFLLDGKRYSVLESELWTKMVERSVSMPEIASKIVQQNWALFEPEDRKPLLDAMLQAMDCDTAEVLETFIHLQQEPVDEPGTA